MRSIKLIVVHCSAVRPGQQSSAEDIVTMWCVGMVLWNWGDLLKRLALTVILITATASGSAMRVD